MMAAKNGKGRGPGRPGLYPWDDWLARPRLVLQQGRDFRCGLVSLTQQLRGHASLRGLSARVREGRDHRGRATLTVDLAPKEGGGHAV
jgi:hypothetical protein